jgi:hypothetical protein
MSVYSTGHECVFYWTYVCIILDVLRYKPHSVLKWQLAEAVRSSNCFSRNCFAVPVQA